MTGHLAPKRKIQSARNWTPGVSDFIRRPMKLDEFVLNENIESIQKRYPKTSRVEKKTSREEMTAQDKYEVSKKAFENLQRYRASQIQKFQNQCEKTERNTRNAKMPKCVQKQRDFTRVPVKHMRDQHLIEHIVAQRNDDYMEVSEYIPQGYVANLGALRKLPPDNKLYVKSSNRVFYWG